MQKGEKEELQSKEIATKKEEKDKSEPFLTPCA